MTTTAIIGHGRSPEGKGWASRIDGCDIVVRMWDCGGWQNPSDHGNRYDYGLIEIGGNLVAKAMQFKKRDPVKGWIASYLHGRTDRLPENTEIVDQRPWNAIGRGLGGVGKTGRLQFTRGTIAACWAIERSAVGDEVILVGFDNIAGGVTLPINEAYAPAYRDNPGTFSFAGHRGGLKKFGNHDFTVERPVMEHLAEKHSVKLFFAQDVW